MEYGKNLVEWFELFYKGNPWTIINAEHNYIMEYINSLNLLNQLENLLFINKGIYIFLVNLKKHYQELQNF